MSFNYGKKTCVCEKCGAKFQTAMDCQKLCESCYWESVGWGNEGVPGVR